MPRRSRTGFQADRLGGGDWVIALAGLALLIDLLAIPWYSLNDTFATTSVQLGAPESATGFQAHAILGPLAMLCALLAVAAWCLQATQRGPAWPVSVGSLGVALAAVLALGLLVRVVFDPPNVLLHGAPGVTTTHTDVGAVVALILAWVLLIAGALSLRRDGILAADGPQRTEMLAIQQRPARSTRAA